MIGALLTLAAAAAATPGTVPNREVVLQFATCVRRRAPDRAEALLRSEPGSDDEHRKLIVIAGAYGACVADRRFLTFRSGMLRGQLAELAFDGDAGLRARAAALPAAAAVRPDAAAIERSVGRVPQDRRDDAYAIRFREAFARCVADADPAGTAALLPTAPASGEERAALMRSSETLMHCMPEGVTYHIIPAELRPYLVAELYYRTVTTGRVGG